jgi:hypothetical protein
MFRDLITISISFAAFAAAVWIATHGLVWPS